MSPMHIIRARRAAAALGALALLAVGAAPVASARAPRLRLDGMSGEVSHKGHHGQLEVLTIHPAKVVTPD